MEKNFSNQRILTKYYYYIFISSLLSLACAIIFFSIIGSLFYYLIVIFIVLFIGSVTFFTIFKKISLNELTCYPIQFLTLDELKKREIKERKIHKLNILFFLVVVIIFIVINFNVIFISWLQLIIYGAGSLAIYESNYRQRLNLLHNKIKN